MKMKKSSNDTRNINFPDITAYEFKGEFKIRLEARLKNSALIKARESLGLTIQEVSDLIGVSANTYNCCELMRYYPSQKIQKRICNFYRKKGVFLFEEDVFPEELRNLTIKRKYIAEQRIPVENLVSLSNLEERYLPPSNEDIEEEAERKDVAKSIDYILSATLSKREKESISLYFGLDGSVPMTLSKIGEMTNQFAESVRQRIAKGIRKLRHPCRQRMFYRMLSLPKRIEIS